MLKVNAVSENANSQCLPTLHEIGEILSAFFRLRGKMSNIGGCQLPCLPKISIGHVIPVEKSIKNRLKRSLAVPWNYLVKKLLKRSYLMLIRRSGGSSMQLLANELAPEIPFTKGDLVRVRSREEIQATLDPFNELRGCAFLSEMYQFCDTKQRVFKNMQLFLDERDYKVKKVRGVILLENVICNGTPTFGECDRCCFLFWREEWLEKVAVGHIDTQIFDKSIPEEFE